MASPKAARVERRVRTVRRDIVAACAGNAVEWYDFAVYGALSTVLAAVFFPADEPGTLLMAGFAVYGTAFVVRPLGAVVIGRLGDSHGRQVVLSVVIVMMAAATAGVGVLPSYAAIGALAPVALIVMRCGQGIAAGGELGVAAVFIAESAPDRRRGAVSAWHTATMAIGIAAGLGVAALLLEVVGRERLEAGWWRIPFLLAVPLGAVGVYLRTRVQESASFSRLTAEQRVGDPVRTLWAGHRAALVTGFTVVAAGALGFNTFFVFLPNEVAATAAVSLPAALGVAVLGLLCVGLATLALGRVSDRVGRRPVVLTSGVALGVLAPPMSAMAARGSLSGLAVAVTCVGFAVGGILSPAMLAEMFPPALRTTGLSLTAGLATALLGGTAPMVDLLLVRATGLDAAPGAYVAVVSAAAALTVWRWRETAFRPLD